MLANSTIVKNVLKIVVFITFLLNRVHQLMHLTMTSFYYKICTSNRDYNLPLTGLIYVRNLNV